jgi:hypothetical protein
MAAKHDKPTGPVLEKLEPFSNSFSWDPNDDEHVDDGTDIAEEEFSVEQKLQEMEEELAATKRKHEEEIAQQKAHADELVKEREVQAQRRIEEARDAQLAAERKSIEVERKSIEVERKSMAIERRLTQHKLNQMAVSTPGETNVENALPTKASEKAASLPMATIATTRTIAKGWVSKARQSMAKLQQEKAVSEADATPKQKAIASSILKEVAKLFTLKDEYVVKVGGSGELGLRLRPDPRSPKSALVDRVSGAAGAMNRIFVGDMLLSINQQSTANMTYLDVVDCLSKAARPAVLKFRSDVYEVW